MPGKRQRRKLGDVLKVPLEDGSHCYARVLPEPLVVFYDARSDREVPVDEVIARPVLFTLWVMNHATTSGRWIRVGNAPLDALPLEPPTFFKQDVLNPKALSLYRAGEERPASREECGGLERAAVWEPEHVEDRLRDHYLGRPNKWVESLRLQVAD